MPHPYPTPRLTPLFELSATLERFDDLGKTPLGHRMMAVVGQVDLSKAWVGYAVYEVG